MCVLLMLNGARAELDLTLVSSDDEAQRILFLNVHSQQGSFLCMAILGFVAAEPMWVRDVSIKHSFTKRSDFLDHM